MWPRTVRLVGGLTLGLIILSIVFLIAMRIKYPPLLRTIRRFNRSVTNQRAMETAGQPGAYASVIQHAGRTSGKPYETPIGPFTTDDGFVIPLPYGTTPDWLKNVQQAGTATILSEGEVHEVGNPQLVTAEEAMPLIPSKYQRSLRWFNVNDFLRVQHKGTEASTEDVDSPRNGGALNPGFAASYMRPTAHGTGVVE